MVKLNNKTVLVTGASRGIGRAIAIELAKAGAAVWGIARSEERLSKLKTELNSEGLDVGVLTTDLMAQNGVENCISALNELGIDPDIIVHNLGGSLGISDPFVDSEKFAEVWKYNVGIAIDLNKHFIPGLKEKGWGRLIHLSTLSTQTYQGNLAYVSAKCALDGYIKNMSRQIAADGIVMCGVAPGLVEIEGRYFANLKKSDPVIMEQFYDEHLPIRRMADAKEIGRLVASLCAPMANYMVGSIVEINGGYN